MIPAREPRTDAELETFIRQRAETLYHTNSPTIMIAERAPDLIRKR